MEYQQSPYGNSPYWQRGLQATVVPQFSIGTKTHLGRILKAERGAYVGNSPYETILYTCENGKITEYDLLDFQPGNGGDATLGEFTFVYADGEFRMMFVEAIGENPYDIRFDGDDMIQPVAVYLTYVGEGQSSATWENLYE